MQMLTPEIRDDVLNGRIPLKHGQMRAGQKRRTRHQRQRRADPDFTAMHGPGDPLPEAGFDMSEEP